MPPLTLSSCLDVMPYLIDYQLRHSADGIEVLAVARQGVDRQALSVRVAGQLGSTVRGPGAEPPEIVVDLPIALERRRERMSKLEQVVTAQSPAAGVPRKDWGREKSDD